MHSGLIYIYYAEIALFLVYLGLFCELSVGFKDNNEPWQEYKIPTMFCLIFALYFLFREIAQLHAMYKLKLAKNWFLNLWNYIDLVASAGTIILIMTFFASTGPGEAYDHFASVIAMFMWMKLLAFIKAFSKGFATFVLLLSTIFYDKLFRSFLGVLIVIVIMFGHAMYLTLGSDEDFNVSCTREGETELDFGSITCTGQSLYLMVLGKMDNVVMFKNSYFAWLLFLSYTFLVVIVLLNVLIAIVGDSYDAALVKAEELFWRSRVELIAEISTTFEFALKLRGKHSNNKQLTFKFKPKLDDEYSDWTGRVLDIVRRVNIQTSSEAARTNRVIKELKDENAEIKDMLKMLMEKQGLKLPPRVPTIQKKRSSKVHVSARRSQLGEELGSGLVEEGEEEGDGASIEMTENPIHGADRNGVFVPL